MTTVPFKGLGSVRFFKKINYYIYSAMEDALH